MIRVTFERQGVYAVLQGADLRATVDELRERFGVAEEWAVKRIEQIEDVVEPASEPTPAPCAWCEAETGERTQGSHGICPRHFAELSSSGFPRLS